MEIVGFALALVAFVLTAAIWFRSSKQAQQATAAREALEAQLELAKAHGKRVEAEKAEVSGRVLSLEAELSEAIARRDEKATARAMWALELERSYRQWRDVIVPSGVAMNRGEVNAGQQLSFAIGQEVERLREEVGVSIRLDGGLDLNLEPDVALGALRVCEELLALAAKEADEVDVSMDERADVSFAVVLSCRGWSGDDSLVDELVGTVTRMAERLDGSVRWERNGDGVKVDVRFPVAQPDSVVDIQDRAAVPAAVPDEVSG